MPVVKTLDEVIVIKNRLEKSLIRHPAVSIIEVGSAGTETEPAGEEYNIRVFVNDPKVGYQQLGIQKNFEGIPIVVKYRKTELQ